MTYKCILADPPWKEVGGGKIKRGADRHYKVMKTRDSTMSGYGASLGLAIWPITYETDAPCAAWSPRDEER